MSSTLLGVAAGLGASAAWALANVFIQAAGRRAGSVRPLFWGQVVGAVAMLPSLWWFRPSGDPVPWSWLGVASAAAAVAYLGMFRAFALGPVSVVSPLVSTWAVVSGALGVALFGERPGLLRLAGGGLVVACVVAIAARAPGERAWRGPKAAVVGWSLASALGFGVMVAALRPLEAALGPALTVLAVWAGQWALSGPVVLRPPLALPAGAWRPAALLGLCEAAGFLSMELGVRAAPVTVVAPASSLSVLFTVILGGAWLGERVGPERLALAAGVVLGVAALGVG